MTAIINKRRGKPYVQSMGQIWIWIIGAGIITQIVGTLCFLKFFFKRMTKQSTEYLPGVSIAKPCYGIKDGEKLNFETFFNQNYQGPFEIIFSVSDKTDPCVPLIEDCIKRYPNVDAKLIISKTRKAYWKKIDAYYDAYQIATHDYFIISDSDVVVQPDYVRQMASSLSESGVSMVTVPQYDMGANNLPTVIKTLGNNCDVAVYVSLLDYFVKQKKVAFGHSIGFRKSEFDSFGEEAWEKLQQYFGDDLILPSLFTDHGKKVVYRNIYCPVRFSNKTFSQMLEQQRRFAICQKIALGLPLFVFGFLLFPQVTSFIFVIASGFDRQSMKLFLAVWILRVFVSLIFEGLINKTILPTVKYFWTIPIWDLLKTYFVFSALLHDKLDYHGARVKILSNSQIKKCSSEIANS